MLNNADALHDSSQEPNTIIELENCQHDTLDQLMPTDRIIRLVHFVIRAVLKL